jgi:integrase
MPIYNRKVKNKKSKDGIASNREGTVYDVYFKYNSPEGKQTYAKRGFTDRKEAQEHESEMRLKLAKPTYSLKAAEEGKKSLKEYLAGWLEQYAKTNVRPNTYGGYERNIRNHINPSLGDTPINAISAPMLDTLYRKLLNSGLAVNTVKYVHRTLSIALQHALCYQYIDSNPTRNILTKFTAKVKTPTPYTIEQMQQLLEGVKDTQWEFIVVLGGLYGLRRNELLGLRWSNIDIERSCFNIVEQLACTEAKKATGDIFAELKENYSLRTLPITNEARIYFERQRSRRVVPINPDADFIVCRDDGHPLSEGHVSRNFNKLIKEFGLPYLRFHDLRHTAATNMHQLTGDFYTVGAILGHSLKGIGNQLGIIGGLEAVTERYVDVRLERKRVILETYHKAIQKKKNKELER